LQASFLGALAPDSPLSRAAPGRKATQHKNPSTTENIYCAPSIPVFYWAGEFPGWADDVDTRLNHRIVPAKGVPALGHSK
jgi:hypothetical protein